MTKVKIINLTYKLKLLLSSQCHEGGQILIIGLITVLVFFLTLLYPKSPLTFLAAARP